MDYNFHVENIIQPNIYYGKKKNMEWNFAAREWSMTNLARRNQKKSIFSMVNKLRDFNHVKDRLYFVSGKKTKKETSYISSEVFIQYSCLLWTDGQRHVLDKTISNLVKISSNQRLMDIIERHFPAIYIRLHIFKFLLQHQP